MKPFIRQPRGPVLPPLAADSLALQLTVAADAIAAVNEGYALNDGLVGLWKAHPELPVEGRASVQDMVFGCLRDYGRSELMLKSLLRQPLTALHVDGLLRLALYRLETRADIAHTVVDQAVEAAARMVDGGLKGLVNGVLRTALREWDKLMADCANNEVATYRHPDWWLAALKRSYPDHWMAIAEAGNQRSPMCLRVNPRRANLTEMQDALSAAGHTTRLLGEAGAHQALRMEKPVAVASLPGVAEGRMSVQDWGAQQAALLIDLKDGQYVLDACAAPGGKSAHMLELADIELLSVDVDANRLDRVSAQFDRLGLTASLAVGDARKPRQWWDGKRQFDRILADVPCTASGVVRRHPDIKWLRQREDIARFAALQAEILDALWPSLAAGGKMLYVTCSVFPQENDLQVAAFARRHADCERLPMSDGALDRQFLPNIDHDGFYYALLQKRA